MKVKDLTMGPKDEGLLILKYLRYLAIYDL